MKILFITSTRLGDGVLSTGALDHFIRQYPGADITVACGPLVTGIFEAAPGVRRVIPLKKEPWNGHWRKLARETLFEKWDIVIDLRNSLLSRAYVAKKKYIWGHQDRKKHKVEQIAEVIKVSPPPAPTLWFSKETLQVAEKLVPADAGTVLAVGPAANWPAKTWPAENFIALIKKITAENALLPGARIAVFAAPGEEETAYKVLNAFPPEKQIDVIAKAKPIAAAAAIQRCQFYIGNDSGLMHSAAAGGIPTLGLFGPSWPHLYSPWGKHAAWVSTPENFDQLISYPDYDPKTAPCLMASLTVEAAWEAAQKLWKSLPEKSAAA
jgi:ADP-heptose:LPS heptosyltransferase